MAHAMSPSEVTKAAVRQPVCVVGAGIIGLTVAKRLLEEGFAVCIIARETVLSSLARCSEAEKQAYTSVGSGGLWWPFHIEPEEKIPRWGTRTFRVLEEHSKNLLCGIDMLEGFVLNATQTPKELPWYAEITDMELVTPETDARVPKAYASALKMRVPIVQTDIYLKWLYSELMEVHKVKVYTTLHDWSSAGVTSYARDVLEADVIVNCTGVGAREFANDDAVTPGRGVLLFGHCGCEQSEFKCWFTEAEDDGIETKSGMLCYAFPRGKHRVTMGGTFERGDWNLNVEQGEIDALRARVGAVEPCLQNVKEISRWAGLRPLRDGGVRLEADPKTRVVHNYGHGGGGVTVCWGCADDAVELVRDLLESV